jgi:hypothetical protein
MQRDRLLRLVYSLVAFAGAGMLHNIDRGFVVFAQGQSQAQQQYERRDWDRHDEKEREINDHLTATDARLSGVAEKVSLICGVGATIVTGLGVLNLLGFIRTPSRSEPPGKTHFITPE